jgi:hypothetical protein
MAQTSDEIAKEIVVAFCSRIKEVSHYDMKPDSKFNAIEMGKALASIYAEVLKGVRKAVASSA